MTATVRAIYIYPWCKEKLDAIKQDSLSIFPQSLDFISLFRLSLHLKFFVNFTLTNDAEKHVIYIETYDLKNETNKV